jgi:hypothetical protein
MVFNPLIRIPMPDVEGIEQLAQIGTPDGLICVYWVRDTNQAVFEYGTKWYIQDDTYILDAMSEILGIKESKITVMNLIVGNMNDPTTFNYADEALSNAIYNCKWSDYTCDYLIMKADLDYPYDDYT